MEKELLKIEKLNKYFGKKHILKDVSFSIDKGDILGFIGPNGSGKTTTIKIALGLQYYKSGKVTINGFDIKDDFEKAIRNVGAIVENPDFYMYLSGYQNLKLVANLYDNVTDDDIKSVLKTVKLDNRCHDKVSKYSLGMRQRLGIACSLLNNPNLLLLDEPTNGLDPEGIKELRDLLHTLAKTKNMGILVSSHNLSELESFCNKVCIIQNGVIIETTEVKSIKKKLSDQTFIIEVNNTSGINKLLNDKIDIISESIFKIHCKKSNIPEVVKKLIKGKYDIFSISEEELSLEEAFLNRTGGNKID